MKKQELYKHLGALTSLSNIPSTKLSYAVFKNKKKLESEIKDIEANHITNPDFKNFENARIDLCKKHTGKDDQGNFAIKREMKNGVIKESYNITDMDKFNADFEALKIEFKDVIARQEINDKAYNDFLNTDIDFEFYKIDFNSLPDNLTTEQLESIEPFLSE